MWWQISSSNHPWAQEPKNSASFTALPPGDDEEPERKILGLSSVRTRSQDVTGLPLLRRYIESQVYRERRRELSERAGSTNGRDESRYR